jgi:hypothetical protein
MTFAGSLLLVAALGLASITSGRLFVGAFGTGLLRHFDPEGAAASSVLGTAILTLGSIWLSAVGLPAEPIVHLLAALHLVPLALCWRRRRLDVLRPRGPVAAWLALLLPAAAALVAALLPVLRTNGYLIGNDTFTYCAFSEWLQRHGFAETARPVPQSPVNGIPWLWQRLHYDLGIAHLLALVQAVARPPIALLAYPATAAWAMVLVVSGLFLVARWVLRLTAAWTGMAAAVFAVAPHAVYWGHHNGFLQQTYALAVLLLGLALLPRSLRPPRWRLSTAALLAVPIAFLIAVYLPMLPVLGAGAAAALAAGVRHARHRGDGSRGLGFLGAVAALVTVFAFRDLVGVAARFRMFATDVGGAHIPFDALEFVQFGLGTRVLAPGWTNVVVEPWSTINRMLTAAYLALALLGLWRAWRRRRAWGLAAAASLLGLALGYYALVARDPWTHRVGHTWNVFKLVQWAFPAVFLLEVQGLRLLVRRALSARALAAGLAWALPFSLIAVHWVWSEGLGQTMHDLLPGPRPLQDLPVVKRRILDLPPGTLLVVGRPANRNRWLSAITSLLAYPRSIIGDWSDSASIGALRGGGEALYVSLLRQVGQPQVVPIIAGFVPFQTEGVEDLGAGYVHVLSSGRPLVVHVLNPAGLKQDQTTGRPAFDIGEGRTKIVMFSPLEASAELVLTLRPYPGRPGSRLLVFRVEGDYDHRSVRLAAEGKPALVVPLGGETVLHIPLFLSRGLTTAVLAVEDARSAASALRALTVVDLKLTPSPPRR